jgi:hypothetical protein
VALGAAYNKETYDTIDFAIFPGLIAFSVLCLFLIILSFFLTEAAEV